jgi:hypothetical protein
MASKVAGKRSNSFQFIDNSRCPHVLCSAGAQ